MKVLLEKLNKKVLFVSTMVVILVVLICHVFILEVDEDNNIKQDEHRDNIDREYGKKRESVGVDLGREYIEIIISSNGKKTDNISSLGLSNNISATIVDGVLTITLNNLQIKTEAQYGIKIEGSTNNGHKMPVKINISGSNIIEIDTAISDKAAGIHYSDGTNMNINIEGSGILDIEVKNSSTSANAGGYGIYTGSSSGLNIEVGALTIDSPSQGIYAGGGSCTITVPEEGGSVDINGTKYNTPGTNNSLDSSQLQGLVPKLWPDTYYLEFNVQNGAGNLYAVDGETRNNVMSQLPDTLEVDGITLTLKDYVFRHSNDQTVALKITGSGNATLKLDGTNELKVNNGNAISVGSDVNLTIESDTNGSLNIQRGTAGSLNIEGSTAGISVGGTVDVYSGAVTARAEGGTGILCADGTVTASGGSVTAQGTINGITCGALDIKGTAAVNTDTSSASGKAINATGDVSINTTGIVIATANAEGGIGISATNITISNGTVNATAASTSLKGSSSVSITGGTVNATVNSSGSTAIEAGSAGLTIGTVGGGSATPVVTINRHSISDDSTNPNNEGIYSAGSINMLSGTVTIGDAAGCNFGIGILANGNLNITNGTITSYGLYKGIASNGTMVISNGIVTGQTVATSGTTYGIYGAKTLTINNGEVHGIATSSVDSSHGIFSQNEMKIVDGKVAAEVKAYYSTGIKVNSAGIVIGDMNNIQVGDEEIQGPTITVKRDAPYNHQEAQDRELVQNEGIYALYVSYIYGGDIKVEGNFGNGIEVTSEPLNIYGGIIDIYGRCKGIWIESGLNIAGGNITCNTGEESYSAGIYAKRGDLVISGGVINSTANGGNARGIVGAEGANITVTDGQITATGNGSDAQGILIDEGNLDVIAGTIKAIGSGSSCKGINISKGKIVDGVYNGVNIEGGTVEAEVTGYNGMGIRVGLGSFKMSGGTVNVLASNANYLRGIDNENGIINISGGEVTVDAVGPYAYGIYNRNDELKIANATVRVTVDGNYSRGIMNDASNKEFKLYSGNIYVNIYGVYAKGLQTLGTSTIGEKVGDQGPTIVVRGDINNTNNDYNECAFYSNDMTINAGYLNVDLNSTDATKGAYGIAAMRVTGSLTVNGGNLEVNANVLHNDGTYGRAHGIDVTGYVTINGGRVVCTTNGSNTDDAGLYVGSTSTLTINGGDSKFANTNMNNVNGYGVKVNGQVMNVNAGYAIIQGMKQAIDCGEVNYSETITDANGNDTSVMARACVDYDGSGTLVGYNSSNNSEYKYVEFGVSYSYYLYYEGGVMYKGNSGVSFTPAELGNMGISLGSDVSKITFNNIKFTSSSRYGLYADRAITIVLKENSVNQIDVTGEKGSNETYGAIYSTGTVTIEGKGELVLKAKSQVIKATGVTIGGATDGELVVEKASESYDGTSDQAYPNISDWSDYKYVKFAKLENYYFKYKANSGEMYRVVADGSSEKKLKNNHELVIGWSIESDGGDGHILQLKNFNFSTRAKYGLVVEGNATITVLESNSIEAIYNDNDSYAGIEGNGNIEISGTGSLTLNKTNHTTDKFTALKSAGNVAITGGTYTFAGEVVGIDCGKNLTIRNSTITAKGNEQAIKVTSNCTPDVYESIKASTSYNGSNLDEITDFNKRIRNTGNNDISGFKYIDMQLPVYSVNITWGALHYTCQSVWNPNSHSYEGVWSVNTDNDADIVKVENNGSNMPVKSTITTDIANTKATELGITATFVSDRDSEDERNQVTITAEKVLTASNGILQKFFVLSGLPKNNYATATAVGNVKVKLEDASE